MQTSTKTAKPLRVNGLAVFHSMSVLFSTRVIHTFVDTFATG